MIILLRLGDIRGESTISGYLDWIEIQSMSEAMSSTAPTDGPRTTTLSDMHVTKFVDRATVRLREACVNETLIGSGEMCILRPGRASSTPILRYKFSNVTITSVQFGVTSGDENPMDQVSFDSESVEWIYTHLDKETGEPIGSVSGKAVRQKVRPAREIEGS